MIYPTDSSQRYNNLLKKGSVGSEIILKFIANTKDKHGRIVRIDKIKDNLSSVDNNLSFGCKSH